MDPKFTKSVDEIRQEMSLAEIIAIRDRMILAMNEEIVKMSEKIKEQEKLIAEKDTTIANLTAENKRE